ncbi:MAG: choice-of-anchor D domain-containing protein [Calditrichaeota bacterium]|nr:MAG: choice-of-anchor D domain-containing protein [Calditrichota bacterium]
MRRPSPVLQWLLRTIFRLIGLVLGVLLFGKIGLAQPAPGPWPMFRHDPPHTGSAPHLGPVSPAVTWQFAAGDTIISSPAVGPDGAIYVGSGNGTVFAVNPDGSERWRFFTEGPIVSSPALDSLGNVYIGSGDGALYALRSDGSLAWRYQTGGEVNTSPNIGPDGTIYFGSRDGNVYALFPDGSLRWEFAVTAPVESSPALAPDGSVYFGADNGILYALDSLGNPQWEFLIGDTLTSSPAIGPDGTIYIGSHNGNLYAVFPDGTQRWSFPTQMGIISSPAITPTGNIVFGSQDGSVYMLLPTGSQVWFLDTGAPIVASPAIDRLGNIYVGNLGGDMYGIAPTGAVLWQLSIAPEGFASSPALGPAGILYVGGMDRNLYAIAPAAPVVHIFPRLLHFGAVAPGSDSTQIVSVSNVGTDDLEIFQTVIGGPNAGEFEIVSGGGPGTLPPGTTRDIEIRFAPQSTGIKSAALTITHNGPTSPDSVGLSGIGGVGGIALTPWPMFRHDPQRTALSPFTGPIQGALQWQFPTGDIIRSSPAIDENGNIYIGSYDHFLYSLRPDGSLNWSVDLGSPLLSSPTLAANGNIYIGGQDGNLYALDRAGNILWAFPTRGSIASSPAVGGDGTVYVGSDDSSMYAIYPDGTLFWEFPAGGMISSSPAQGFDGTLYVGSLDGNVYALLPDGSPRWTFQTGAPISATPAIDLSGTVYVGNQAGQIYALTPDGLQLWAATVEGGIVASPALLPDGRIVFPNNAGELDVFQPTGVLDWVFPVTSGVPVASPVVGANGLIYFGAADGRVYAVDLTGGEAWHFTAGGGFSGSPALNDRGTLYIGSLDNSLYAIGGQMDPFMKLAAGPVSNDDGFSNGSAWGDMDGDGDPDLFVSNGQGENNFLYRNDGPALFSKITLGAIVNDGGNSGGAVWADYDNDGDNDLFVANDGGENNFLYRNNGDGTFTPVTNQIVVNDGGNSQTAAWADYDRDGLLDLVVTNALEENNALYRNLGGGNFQKILTGPVVNDGADSRGAAWGDYDNDGDPDLFIANFDQENYLYRNNGDGTFTRVFDPAIGQDAGASTGASWGDYDNDGDLDLYVTNQLEPNFLYRNNGDGTFTAILTGPPVFDEGDSRSSTWVDFDNDGDVDLFVADGSGNNQMYINLGVGGFTPLVGSIIVNDGGASNSCSWGDFDRDGFPDLFVANDNQENNALYRNLGNANHWVAVQLTGAASNRSAIGARVIVWARVNGFPVGQLREITTQDGFGSQGGPVAMFGLGAATIIDSLIIHWPSGLREVHPALAVDQYYLFTENPPRISISPRSVDFGTVEVGQSAQDTITLTNGSLTPLVISGMTIGGANAAEFFLLTGSGSDTLAPGDTRPVAVQFLPESGGAKSAALIIESNALSSPDSVHLSGFAVRPFFVRQLSGPVVNDSSATRGCAWGDYDNDGDPDLFIANYGQNNRLYRNDGPGTGGEWNFTEITTGEIVNDGASSVSASWGDYDNDGWLDLFVANDNGEENLLYRNNGDGTFTRMTGIGLTGTGFSQCGVWGDFDRDGRLDLFVANDQGENNFLYQNNGDGTFTQILEGPVVNDGGHSRSAAWVDYDNDGWPDLFVFNAAPGGEVNFLYRNNGDSTFTRITQGDIANDAHVSHGGSWGDYDNDGYPDLFVANFGQDNALYRNLRDGRFTKILTGPVVSEGGSSTGSAWADYDRDGDLDLFVANDLGENNRLYANNGDGTFSVVTEVNVVNDDGYSTAATWADYNSDGAPDLFVTTGGGDVPNNVLYRNPFTANNWLAVRCVGVEANRAGLGSRVRVKAVIQGQPVWQVREISGQTGRGGQNPPVALFGLGDAPVVDSLVVEWPGPSREDSLGVKRQVLLNVPVNQSLTVVETFPLDVQISSGVTVGQSASVVVRLPSFFSPTEAQFFYRRGGESAYQSGIMVFVGQTYTGTIPSEYVTLRGVEYYLRFSDGRLTVTFPAIDPENHPAVLAVGAEQFSPPITLAPRTYRMISIPAELADPTVAALLQDDYGEYDTRRWRLFRWRAGLQAYAEFPHINEPFTPGRAFWLITRDGEAFDVENATSMNTAEGYTITLSPGWNQIGNPFPFPVAWGDVTNSQLVQAPVGWDGQEYQYNQALLQPWEGYFVFNPRENDVPLTVPPRESGGTFARAFPEEAVGEGFLVQLAAVGHTSHRRDTQNFVGMLPGAAPGLDPGDWREAPPIGDYLRISLLREEIPLAGDFTSPSPEGAYWDIQMTTTGEAEWVDITFTGITDESAGMPPEAVLPPEFRLYLLDRERQIVVPVRQGRARVWMAAAPAVRRLRLIVGTEAFAGQHSEGIPLTPVQFALEQNYPNPFNPATTIPYRLAERSRVKLEIYDLLGRRVRTLVQAVEATGAHRQTWDGRDDRGHPVASGIYIYRLEAEPVGAPGAGFRQARKLVLLR